MNSADLRHHENCIRNLLQAGTPPEELLQKTMAADWKQSQRSESQRKEAREQVNALINKIVGEKWPRPKQHKRLTHEQVAAIDALKAAELAYLQAIAEHAPGDGQQQKTARIFLSTATMWVIQSIAVPEE